MPTPSTLDATAVQQYTTQGKQLHAVDFILHIIPDTVVGAFANGEILQVLLIAILFGDRAGVLPAARRRLWKRRIRSRT